MINKFFTLGIFIYFIGFLGIFLTRRNIIIILIAIELMLLGVSINFILLSIYFDDFIGQIFSFFILAMAGAEASIGLAILIIFYRVRGLISLDFISGLKG